MSKSTISTFELFAMFPDQETARKYLEARLWPNGATCPVCGLGERITARKGGFYRCNQCKEDFTVRTGHDFRAQPRSAAQVGLRDVPACDGAQGHLQHAARKGNRRHTKVGVVPPASASRSLCGPIWASCKASLKSMRPMSAASRRTSTSTRSLRPVAGRSARPRC